MPVTTTGITALFLYSTTTVQLVPIRISCPHVHNGWILSVATTQWTTGLAPVGPVHQCITHAHTTCPASRLSGASDVHYPGGAVRQPLLRHRRI